MRFKFCIIFLLLSTFVWLQPAAASGFVRVKNFPKEKYSGGAQNWCAVQDSSGKMYFGNRDGLMVFDGERWRKSYLSNYTTIRTLLYDDVSRRLYAAGTVEFGYFAPSPATGILEYHSLANLLPKSRPTYTEIWKIHKIGQSVWFQADNALFCYTGNAMRVYPMPARISTSANIAGTVYVGLEDGRILAMPDGEKPETLPSSQFENQKIVAILPFGSEGDILIGTAFDGLYKSDGRTFRRFEWSADPFLRQNQLFCGSCRGDDYVFGTVSGGAVLLNMATGKTSYINRETGLQNNTVLNVTFDFDDNLWLCLDNGIDYAVINSPMYNLINRNNSIGAGYVSMIAGSKMLYGTNEGLFSTPFPYQQSPVPPFMKKELPGQIWSITETPSGILVSSDSGVYFYDGTRFKAVSGIHGAYRVLALPGNDGLALAAAYDGYHLLRHSKAGWEDFKTLKGCEDLTGYFFFDRKGNVWVAHWRRGVYRLSLDPAKGTLATQRLFNSKNGLPADDYNTAAEFDGGIEFATRGGFYRLADPGDDKVAADGKLNELLPSKRQGTLQSLPDGQLVFVDNSGMYLMSRKIDGSLSSRQVAAGNFRELLIPGFTNINSISPDELVLSTQDGFNVVNTIRGERKVSRERLPFVSSVYVNRDSLVYSSSFLAEVPLPELTYDLNSVKFEFAYPDFDNAGIVEYSSYLENYEKEWSPFSAENSREYTRLSEGDYKLHLRVRDADTGEIKESTLGFRIQPPWFRTTLAKILYLIGLILALGLLTAGIRHWVDTARRNAEQRKEREMEELRRRSEQDAIVKDYEIASLKTEQLEQDIKHKSQELSTTAMNLIHKNEILNDIAVQLAMIQQLTANDSSRSLILKNLAKIQTSIEKSINEDNDWDTFNKNFDIVYSDYTKRLTELHPNLTTSDKRLCCYIRMGLSSKEIAPLINISYKSVEMARYRLRKKINLPANTTLTDYLTTL